MVYQLKFILDRKKYEIFVAISMQGIEFIVTHDESNSTVCQ